MTEETINAYAAAISGYLDSWKTPDDFQDYVEGDQVVIALDVWFDVGSFAANQLAKLQKGLDAKGIPGFVYLGFTESFGDSTLIWTVAVDDLDYPPADPE